MAKLARPKVLTRSRVEKKTLKRLKIRKILVPIDFSPASLESIEFALPLLNKFGAELHLVHVMPDYPPALPDLPMIAPDAAIARRTRHELTEAAEKYSIMLRPGQIHAIKGRPFEQICQLARQLAIDIIITSTRGNTGLKHIVLGSTAERIVRYSPCPVLVTRPLSAAGGNGERARRRFALGKILVATDFSEDSVKAIDFVIGLAREFRSQLVLLHAVHFEYYVTNDEYARYDFPLLMQQAEKAAREQMREFLRDRCDGILAKGIVVIGHPCQEICGRAQEFGADLIVTATHGRTGLKHLLIGSTAEYVVRHAICPVLIVPSHQRLSINSNKSKP